jgi:hypothetical protein
MGRESLPIWGGTFYKKKIFKTNFAKYRSNPHFVNTNKKVFASTSAPTFYPKLSNTF